MARHYKFDTHDEKIDEVELVTADEEKKPREANGRTILPALTAVLQLVILCLLIFLTALTLYNTVRGDGDSTCTTSSSDSSEDTAASVQQQCSIIQQDLQQQINNITQLLREMNNSDKIIMLLQEMYTEQMVFQENATEMMSITQEHTENSLLKLMNIIGTLSNHRDTSIAAAAVIDDILIVVEELLQLQNISILFNSVTPVSCKDIKKALPTSPSGYYHVNSRNIYCNMEELCGSSDGWTRIAYLDMDDSTQSCPTGFQLFESGGARACGRSSTVASCSPSAKFPSNGISYNEVCGRVFGYQKGSPDAVYQGQNDINSFYVDGISLTRGSPRQHIWTFMGGLLENHFSAANCPCNVPSPGVSQQVQTFVGSHYFCESGDPEAYFDVNKLYTADPLWDGKGCGAQEGECCSDGLPWFHRQYENATTDYLELRVCGDQGIADEDVPVAFYEIYVK